VVRLASRPERGRWRGLVVVRRGGGVEAGEVAGRGMAGRGRADRLDRPPAGARHDLRRAGKRFGRVENRLDRTPDVEGAETGDPARDAVVEPIGRAGPVGGPVAPRAAAVAVRVGLAPSAPAPGGRG